MTTHLYLAPAGAGKTRIVLEHVCAAAQGLHTTPRVCVPTPLQARAWRRRLAQNGGALGVRVGTFNDLYHEILNTTGDAYTLLEDPVQYRLLRAVVDDLDLDHYAAIVTRPGFIQSLQSFIRELKNARIPPAAFLDAVAAAGDPPRLRELGQVYAAYQIRLQAQGWADHAGLGWLAVEALAERAPAGTVPWSVLAVDGFDSFTETQVALLRALSDRVDDLIITLTGDAEAPRPRFVHQRFHKTRQRLEAALAVAAEPLPDPVSPPAGTIAHLEAGLFAGEQVQRPDEGTLTLVAAPDRAAEVRAALRWLKQRLVEDSLRPHEVALLARDVGPYRPFIRQTAVEFGLPVRFVDGLPLARNPAVAALLDLLRLALPRPGSDEPALPRRPVVEAWRSPYFDWEQARHEQTAPEPIGITARDADALDAVARWGRVIGGQAQWAEVLEALSGRVSAGDDEDGEHDLPPHIPVGEAARQLQDTFIRFLQRILPPQGQRRYRDFVKWLEDLIGPDPATHTRGPLPDAPTALNVVAQARAGGGDVAAWDVAALRAFKEVLRGLIWAEEAVGDGTPISFPRFFDDVVGAVEATGYQPPLATHQEEILVANVVQARGVPLRAVVVLGLAEGEFPTTLREDPFLREVDRTALREEHDLPLESAVTSSEREYFYETITRPENELLLTRPRLAESGAEWPPSPFWEEVRRLVAVTPHTVQTGDLPPPHTAASWPELLQSLVRRPDTHPARAWAEAQAPARWRRLDRAARVFAIRYGRQHTPFDGDLTGRDAHFHRHFHPDYVWNPSRLESYRQCPLSFFVGRVLALAPRPEPEEGLDGRQLGSIYHRIFEELYKSLPLAARTDRERLLKALPAVARRVLDAAPAREGFRATAWWQQTRAEIVENVSRSLEELAALPAKFVPVYFEMFFTGPTTLVVTDEDDQFRLRGVIDRVDVSPAGESRVIDYKTAGPYGYTVKALDDGEKLQLPLYALAARDALGVGEPVEGFYWHVQHGEASDLDLADYGPEAAIAKAVEYAWKAVRGARHGAFIPTPPAGGCPDYCPAAAFCWHYQPRMSR